MCSRIILLICVSLTFSCVRENDTNNPSNVPNSNNADNTDAMQVCNVDTSTLSLERDLAPFEGQGSMSHRLVASDGQASSKQIGAYIKNGTLYIHFHEKQQRKNIELILEIRAQPTENLPYLYCVDDPYETPNNCATEDVTATFSIFEGGATSTATAGIEGGQLSLDTCPSIAGDRVIGRLIDVVADVGSGVETTTTHSAEFTAIVQAVV